MAKEIASSIPGIGFLREAKAELKKVTWPGRKQIWFSTLVVIFFTLCASIYLRRQIGRASCRERV